MKNKIVSPDEAAAILRDGDTVSVSGFVGTGTPDAAYLVSAFGEDLLMTMQLNVRRFVVVYSVPVTLPIGSSTIAPHFERWATGAHFTSEYRVVDGLPIATRREVFARIGRLVTPIPVLSATLEPVGIR